MQVFQALTAEQVDKLRDFIGKLEYEDGRETARGYAKTIKANRQILPSNRDAAPVFGDVTNLIMLNPLIAKYAAPHRVLGLRIASYREGDYYGWHVDFAHMDGHRSDLSFTLCLSDKDEYEGGDLELDFRLYKTSFRGNKGQIIIYPTGVVHRVTEVTKGERLCIVGWVHSLIGDSENREALFRFSQEIIRLRQLFDQPEEMVQLNQLLQHFTRKLSN